MNDLGYRQLRVVESRKRERLRSALVCALAVSVSLLWWLLVLGFIFGANTGPGILR